MRTYCILSGFHAFPTLALYQPRENVKGSVHLWEHGFSRKDSRLGKPCVFWVKTSGQQGLQMHHIPPFHLFYLPLFGNPAAYPRLCRRSSSPSFRPFLLSPDTILLVPVSSPKRDPVEENGCK